MAACLGHTDGDGSDKEFHGYRCKEQLGGIECSAQARKKMAGESGAFKYPTCGRTNAAIIKEREEAAALIEAKEGKKKEEEVPEELRLAYRDELGKGAEAEASEGKGKGKARETSEASASTAQAPIMAPPAPTQPNPPTIRISTAPPPTRTVPAPAPAQQAIAQHEDNSLA